MIRIAAKTITAITILYNQQNDLDLYKKSIHIVNLSLNLVDEVFKRSLLLALITPKEIDNLKLSSLEALNLSRNDLKQFCKTQGSFFSSPELINKSRIILIEKIILSLLQLPIGSIITEHDIANIILPWLISTPTLLNSDKNKLVKQFFDLISELGRIGVKIKPTKDIKEKIAIFYNINSGKFDKTYEWKEDPRRQLRNLEGICRLFTYKNIHLTLAKNANVGIDIQRLKTEKYSYAAIARQILHAAGNEKANYPNKYSYAAIARQILHAARNEKANYPNNCANYQIYLQRKYGYTATYIEAFKVSQFNDIIKKIIIKKSIDNNPILIELAVPFGLKSNGHSTFLSIQLKAIGQVKYYSLNFHDSNFGEFKLFSHSQNLLVPYALLTDPNLIIPNPLMSRYGELAVIILYEKISIANSNAPQEIKIQQSEILFSVIKNNPCILYYCSMIERIEYLEYIAQNKLQHLLAQQNKGGCSVAMLITHEADQNTRAKILNIIPEDDLTLLKQTDRFKQSLAMYLACGANNEIKKMIYNRILSKAPELLHEADHKGKTLSRYLSLSLDEFE